jgi:hypothetical protein
MAREAISITLDGSNLSWLKGRAGAAGESVSAFVDQLVTAARQGQSSKSLARSVQGTLSIGQADPDLEGADAAIQSLYDKSLQRLIVREHAPSYRAAKRRKPRG